MPYVPAASALDGIALSRPCGVAREECPDIGVACLFCRDRGLEARGSAVPAAIEYQWRVLVGGQERSDYREVLLGNVRSARNMAGRILHLRPVIDNDEFVFTPHDRFNLFHIEVLDRTGKETTRRCRAKQYKCQENA